MSSIPMFPSKFGYMLALRKSVCLLSDTTLKKMQTDLVGKLYSPFDTYDIINTINVELSKWLLAKGIAP